LSAQYIFTCNLCDFTIKAWEDGNPYIEHPPGTRQYMYHPGEYEKMTNIVKSILGRKPTDDECGSVFEKYGGNEPDHVCRACYTISRIDPRRDAHACRQCGAASVERIIDLSGKQCVRCDGVFSSDLCAIS
jgi:hypothetical protein